MPDAEDREMVHVRLPKQLIKKIDHMAVDADLYRAGAIERILAWAVNKIETEEKGEVPQLQVV